MGELLIPGPGAYDLPADVYHADPIPGGSLSSSGARRLLPPGCPAKFAYDRDHPPTPTQAMQLGTAAHRVMLGTGAELVQVDAKDWKTKAAQQARKAALAAGKVALLPADHDRVTAMAEALRQSPAAALFHPGTGKAEQALFWKDGPTGVIRRALVDFLRQPEADGRLIVADYKTADKADEESIKKSINTYGYHLQGAWYADGVRALGLAEDVPVVLVVQETSPPYLVNAVQIDDPAMRIGRWRNAQAIGIYAECTRTGVWPGYSDRIEFTGLPHWAESRALEEMRTQ
jgi:hypothetical protein